MSRLLKIFLLCTAAYLLPLKSSGIGEDVCDCIKFRIGATDTLKTGNYLNYSVSVKNTCTYKTWINTSFFGYTLYNQNGTPVKRLRELTFVKRYQYPEYVLLAPNAEYEFKFADDAFYEFKLDHHTRYIVGLKYINKKAKNNSGKHVNFLCSKELKRTVYVK
jgi:hypothetical protein